RRQHDLHRLWEHDAAHRHAPAHAHGHGRLDLAAVDGFDAGPEVLGLVSRICDAQADDGCLHGGHGDAHVGHHKVNIEKQHDDGDAAQHVDHARTELG